MPSLNPVTNTAAGSSLVLKTSAGVLHSFALSSGTSGWVLVFDSATVPADGAVTPLYSYQDPGGSLSMNYEPNPVRFNNGCVIVYSTTGPFTKTASATAHITGQVE